MIANRENRGIKRRCISFSLRSPRRFIRALSVQSKVRGRWMTLRIIADRSGNPFLACTLGRDDSHKGVHESSPGDSILQQQLDPSETKASESPPLEASPKARNIFYNPTWSADRTSVLSVFSVNARNPYIRAAKIFPSGLDPRMKAIFLGSVVELPLSCLLRLKELDHHLEIKRLTRQSEISALPLLSRPRRKHRLVWSGEAVKLLDLTSPKRMTVWQCVPSPGRVSLGSPARLSRRSNGEGNDNSAQGREFWLRSFTA